MEHFIGEKLYLSQQTGSYYVDLVKSPWTVIKVNSDKELLIQKAKCVFNGPAYYDSMPDSIRTDENGEIRTLKLSKAKKFKDKWINKSYQGDTYPYIAHFGYWDYYPYLN